MRVLTCDRCGADIPEQSLYIVELSVGPPYADEREITNHFDFCIDCRNDLLEFVEPTPGPPPVVTTSL